jgi:hypothetical protein
VIALNRWAPHLAHRIVAPRVFLILLLATFGTAIVQSQAIYLRSFKREPFLVQSIVVAFMTFSLSFLTVQRLGALGIALSYLASGGFVGVISGSRIYRSWSRAAASTSPTSLPLSCESRI